VYAPTPVSRFRVPLADANGLRGRGRLAAVVPAARRRLAVAGALRAGNAGPGPATVRPRRVAAGPLGPGGPVGTVTGVGEFHVGPGPVVMGVLNVTPDSFSDGGRYQDLDAAVAHAVAMHQAGADLVDVGGESTRPGAERVDAATETARVLPVITELAAAGVPMSVDTTRASVAAAALEAGAAVVNDVSGGLADPAMTKVVAEAGCPYVIMHWRGHSRRMQELAVYRDVVADVCAELRARVEEAVAVGISPDKIIIDPGFGFAKTPEHNWELTRRFHELLRLGFPVLVGASRKRYLGVLLASPDGRERPVHEREAATIATSVLAVAAGAWGVRVHDVRATVDALAVWGAST
jgi:dihydropteroate synthase